MKLLSFGCLLLVLASSGPLMAQYDPEYQMRRYGGVDRSLTGQPSQQSRAKKDQPSKEEMLEQSVERLTESLSLDSFQAAVIKQLIEDSAKKQEMVLSQDIPDESKTEQIIALRNKLSDKIKEVLNPDQLAKFEELKKKKKR